MEWADADYESYDENNTDRRRKSRMASQYHAGYAKMPFAS